MLHSGTPAFLVEDDPGDVLLFQHAWKKAAAKRPLRVFSTAEHAVESFSELATQPKPFCSSVFLDLKLPGKSGFELLTWMRQESKCRRIPVVVLTGSSHTIDIYRAYELGANSYLVKPVAHDVLSAVLQQLRNMRAVQTGVDKPLLRRLSSATTPHLLVSALL